MRHEGDSAPLAAAPAQPAKRAFTALPAPVYPQPSVPLPRPLRVLPVVARPAPAREHRHEGASELLADIARLANAGASEQARSECQRYLSQYPPSAQVYYWLGLLSDTEGDAQQALSHYRKALYLEPQHPERWCTWPLCWRPRVTLPALGAFRRARRGLAGSLNDEQ